MFSMGPDICLQAELLVRFVVLYFLIHRPLLKCKIILEGARVTQTHFGGILKGSDLCLDAEIVVRFVFLYPYTQTFPQTQNWPGT